MHVLFIFTKLTIIASGNFYKTLKLWEFHKCIFADVLKFFKFLSRDKKTDAVNCCVVMGVLENTYK